MNNFEAPYLKLSSKYLSEKLNMVKAKRKVLEDMKDQDKSKLQKLVSDLFR